MIKFENSTREVAFGRYSQRLETQFVLQSLPAWLTTTGTATWENNGLKIVSTTETKLMTAYFDAEKMVQVSAEFFNLNFNSDSTVCAIRMINEAGTKEVGLYSDPTDSKNIFKYISGGTAVISDDAIGYIGTLMKSRIPLAYSTVNGGFGGKPRNLRLSIFPVEKEVTILENGVPAYTINTYIAPSGADMAAVDFSGRWRFEVLFNNTINCSGVELLIQQNL
ncbi:MAG: hypothetical protein PHI85_04885 [Victivallaceae bacterium]|nr:hypothetical protein [Victivallaceae bacterium]